MPAANIYHEVVVLALEADGWAVTDDPLTLTYGGRNLYVDLGAEQLTIGAERAGRRIAVEVQSFLGHSVIQDFQQALGQYEMYRTVLGETEPDRLLYLALPQRIREGLLAEQLGTLLVSRLDLKLLVFDESEERIVEWIG